MTLAVSDTLPTSLKLEKALKLKLASGSQEIDILHWMGRTALEMIGQSGLGYSFDSLLEDTEPHPCYQAAKAFPWAIDCEQEYLLPIALKIGTPRFRRWVLDRLPIKNWHRIRDIADTWDHTTTKIFEEKKRALEAGDEALANQVDQAKDLMSLLMKANMEASEEEKLPDAQVLGQCMVDVVSEGTISFNLTRFILMARTFVFAATDTTSNALSRTLSILATHPEVQERLRVEVTEARKVHGGDIPYDHLVELPFMDAVCRETLRLYAPVTKALRAYDPNSVFSSAPASPILHSAQRDAILPLSTPIKGVNGREMDSILVPKGTRVVVSILNANTDPLLWGPDSLEWKPERWLAPLPDALREAHMPGIYSHL
ncbi:hypothetical protein H0H87_010721, partial [Tephrocybe sp. NHM501043]